MNPVLASLLVGAVLLGTGNASAQLLTSELQAAVATSDPDEEIAVIIRFASTPQLNFSTAPEAARRHEIIAALRQETDLVQAPVWALLSANGARDIRRLWIINALAARLPVRLIETLAKYSDITRIGLDGVITLPVTGTAAFGGSPKAVPSYTVGWNLAAIGAPELWAQGIDGQGVVIATMDTGADLAHPALGPRWRGGANSWYDPYGQYASPVDNNGHGTRVMGVIVAGDIAGQFVGVAPGAQWIAVKIFDDSGNATLSRIHLGYQWLLELADDAPDIVNNSWTMQNTIGSCNTEFQQDIAVLKSAGIAVVFAAGNSGPNPATSTSPPNNPGSVAVGGVDEFLEIYPFSGRGPSACGLDIFPELTAPGVNVVTTDRSFGGIIPDATINTTGTSVAAPHLVGGMALLKSAVPDASVAELEMAVMETALDLGDPEPDDIFGFGMMDLVAAYDWLVPGGGVDCLPGDYFSKLTNKPINGVTYRKHDVVHYDGAGSFTLFFDGSDVGIPNTLNLAGFAFKDCNELLLSFNAPVTLPGVGTVDDSDIVLFTAASVGEDTAGSFGLFLRGADVGLSSNGEDIDALEYLPGGALLISTRGNANVPGLSTQRDEDLLLFTPDTPGDYSSGNWSVYFDGSDVGLNSSNAEDVNSAAVDSGDIYLTTRGDFVATGGFSGADEDVARCQTAVTGLATGCGVWSLHLDGSAVGLDVADEIDAYERWP